MFDKIDIEAAIPDYIQSRITTDRHSKDVWLGDIVLVPVKCPKTRIVTKYKAQIENLHITYLHRTSTIRVSNSIHKFAKGNNYSDMSFSELLHALQKIVEITGIDLEHWCIKKLEIGFI